MRFAPLGFAIPGLDEPLQRAVTDGLTAACAMDGGGRMLAVAGLEDEQMRAIAAASLGRVASSKDRARMMAGEQVTAMLDDQAVAVAIVEQCVFVIAVQGAADGRSATAALRDAVAQMIRDVKAGGITPSGGSGGSSSGPAELPLRLPS